MGPSAVMPATALPVQRPSVPDAAGFLSPRAAALALEATLVWALPRVPGVDGQEQLSNFDTRWSGDESDARDCSTDGTGDRTLAGNPPARPFCCRQRDRGVTCEQQLLAVELGGRMISELRALPHSNEGVAGCMTLSLYESTLLSLRILGFGSSGSIGDARAVVAEAMATSQPPMELAVCGDRGSWIATSG
jgi:hypothetical protein